MLSSDWPSMDVAQALRTEDLAVAILFELGEGSEERLKNRNNFINQVVDGDPDGWVPGGRLPSGSGYIFDTRELRNDLKSMVGEAWDLLARENFIGPDPTQDRNSSWVRVTPKGKQTLNRPRSEAIAMARAVAALNHTIHPRLLRQGVDSKFRAGDVDAAIRDAYRDVEYVVRILSGLPNTSPVGLMEDAFATNVGPLADHGSSKPQQNARCRLFMGAFGEFRNAPNHTYVSYDPGEAVEIVLLASLLMRKLDEVGTRIGTMPIDVV